MSPRGRWLHRGAWVLGGLVIAVVSGHYAVLHRARLEPPLVAAPKYSLEQHAPGLRWYGRSYSYEADGIIEARLEGSPEEIGWAIGTLLRRETIEIETRLFEKFEHYVPRHWARTLLLDWARIRYAHLDRNLGPRLRQELAAQSRAIEPDPFASFMPTYQRLVYLSSLYDVSLSFEHAPLVGCTTFLVRGPGHSFMARNFDFEVDDVFDEKKVVYLMIEQGAIPFASVAWPGLPGVVSAMNAFGLAVVAHGARGGEFDFDGEPVLQTLRSIVGHAKTSREAVELLRSRRPMVSHIVVVTDAQGDGNVVERIPRQPQHTYRVAERAVVTNHFIGPAVDDPKNVRVKRETSTTYRERRGEQLLAELPPEVNASNLVGLLRNREGTDGAALPLGDRRAIGALIAAHGVVFDCTALKLWVSTAPHLLGKFVELDLHTLLDSVAAPLAARQHRRTLAEDDLLSSGGYHRWRTAAETR